MDRAVFYPLVPSLEGNYGRPEFPLSLILSLWVIVFNFSHALGFHLKYHNYGLEILLLVIYHQHFKLRKIFHFFLSTNDELQELPASCLFKHKTT